MSRRDETLYRSAEASLIDAVGVEVREHAVDVAEPRTTVRVLEVGEGPPVMLVHGSPNTAASWLGLAAELTDHRCLLVERPGAGLSKPVRPWRDHRRESAAILAAVADHFGITEVDVIGSSFGGLYAYNLALAHPDLVRRLILIGAPAGPATLPMLKIFRVLSLPFPVFLLKNGLKPDTEGARAMYAEIGHQASVEAGVIPDVVFQWYASLLSNTDTLEHLVREIRAVATPFGYRRRTVLDDETLGRIATPMLYLWGSEDPFAGPADGDELCRVTGNARIEHLPGFGHLPWYDDATIVSNQIRSFLAPASTADRGGNIDRF